MSSGQSTKQCTGHLRLSADTQSDLTPSQGPWLISTTGPTNQAAIDRCTDPKGSLGDAKVASWGTPVVSPPVLFHLLLSPPPPQGDPSTCRDRCCTTDGEYPPQTKCFNTWFPGHGAHWGRSWNLEMGRFQRKWATAVVGLMEVAPV